MNEKQIVQNFHFKFPFPPQMPFRNQDPNSLLVPWVRENIAVRENKLLHPLRESSFDQNTSTATTKRLDKKVEYQLADLLRISIRAQQLIDVPRNTFKSNWSGHDSYKPKSSSARFSTDVTLEKNSGSVFFISSSVRNSCSSA